MNYNNIIKGPISHPVVFNAFFSDKKLLSSFLNATDLFNVDEESITILKNTIEGGVDFKTSNFDVLFELFDDKTIVDMEMQNNKPKYDMMLRLTYYLAKIIARSLLVKEEYKKNYSIVFAILNYTAFNDDNYMRVFELDDKLGNRLPFTKIIVLELTKKDNCDKKELKKWLDVFNQNDLSQIKEEGIMSEVKKKLSQFNSDYILQAQLDAYEIRQKDLATNRSIELKEAKEEGKAEGLAEGLERGLEQGLAEGIQKANLENAKQLKSFKVAIDIISKTTGLSKEEIEKL